MKSQINLIEMIGVRKTLIIGCRELDIDQWNLVNNLVSVYALPNMSLQRHDEIQKSCIRNLIESQRCEQIVFVGLPDKFMIQSLLDEELLQYLHKSFKFTLDGLFNGRTRHLTSSLLDQMLVEHYIVAQCKFLMDYYFIREQVDLGLLKVRGCLVDVGLLGVKTIFHNGVVYNDIISMN